MSIENIYKIENAKVKINSDREILLNRYSISSDNRRLTIEIPNKVKEVVGLSHGVDKLTLKKDKGYIKLFEDNLICKNNEGHDVIVDEKDIIGSHKEDILSVLQGDNEVQISLIYIKSDDGNTNFSLGIDCYQGINRNFDALLGVLPPSKIGNNEEELYYVIDKKGENNYEIYISTDSEGKNKIKYVKNINDNKELEYFTSFQGNLEEFITYSEQKCTRKELKIIPVKKITNYDKQEVEIRDECEKVIAKFSKYGFFFHNDMFYIRDYISGKITMIPDEFHFLKFVTSDKLALCNSLGNLFYNYKKYDPVYGHLMEDGIWIDKGYIIDSSSALKKYDNVYSTSPPFYLKKAYESLSANVVEVLSGKKIGSLIDEFIYYTKDNKICYNYHDLENCVFNINSKVKSYDENLTLSINNDNGDSYDLHPIFL